MNGHLPMNTADDFKELTGPDALDEVAGDMAGIVEIDEEEAPVVEDEIEVVLGTDDGSLSEEEEQTDDMMEYMYGEKLDYR